MSLSAYRDAVGIEAGGLSTRELRIKAQADDQNPKAKAAIHAAKADDYAAVLIVLSLVVTLGVHHG
ncbi:hypothetical protein [Roseovarius albus]|nr:hypothetical protein [Roseovarius albus]